MLYGEYWFTLDEMTTVVGHKWEYGEPMTVRVKQENGLAKGEQKRSLNIKDVDSIVFGLSQKILKKNKNCT